MHVMDRSASVRKERTSRAALLPCLDEYRSHIKKKQSERKRRKRPYLSFWLDCRAKLIHISQARDMCSPRGVSGGSLMLARSMYDKTSASEMVAELSRSRNISAVSVTSSACVLALSFRFLLGRRPISAVRADGLLNGLSLPGLPDRDRELGTLVDRSSSPIRRASCSQNSGSDVRDVVMTCFN